MKKFIFLYLLFQSPLIFSQEGWADNYSTDRFISYQDSKISTLYPIKNLVLLDKDRKYSNDNHWMLNQGSESMVNPSEQFSSLLLAEQLEQLNQSTPFNVSHNATLERFIRVYLKDRRENLDRLLGKAAYYFPIFEQYLDKFDLPLEIKYLAVVESALNPSAISTSGAKGLWQFMYGTGLEYNLQIDSYIDERYDYIKSTEAACAYLQKLYKTFNDWDLALAAYNSGPGNVKKAIKRAGGNTNYWEIRQFLPQETQSYVPAFYATFYLFSYADYHGLKPQKSELGYYQTDTVHIKGSLSFESIHKGIGIDNDLLKSLNPQYKKEHIPQVKERRMILTLPLNMMSSFLEKEQEFYEASSRVQQKIGASKVIPIKANNSYTVKPGENLQHIANKHHISIDQLKSWNGLQTNFLIEGQSLVVTDKNDIVPMLTQILPVNAEKGAYQITNYTVEYGDTLFKISRKFENVSIPQLRSWNNLNDVNYLKPGTLLKIYKPIQTDESSGISKS
jgi:membrane-bound lytic murein transglycosylase D